MKSPNLIVIVCHDLGQYLGCYGVAEARTPNIDQLAAEGMRFENNFCCAPQCSPSRAGLWTGRFPHANGVVGLTHGQFGNDLNPGETHLAEVLREHGYETHLWGGAHEMRTPEGRFAVNHGHNHTAIEMGDGVAAWLQQRGDDEAPFFIEMNTFEPHRPFPHEGVEALPHESLSIPPYLPDIPEVREDLAEMEASIACVDLAVGKMRAALQEKGLAENTLFVFTVDHGIPFTRAKMTLYDPGLETALIMAGPGIEPGQTKTEMISNVDLFPTLLDYLKLPVTGDLHGRSFTGLLDGSEYQENEFIFGEKTFHTYYDPMRGVRTKKWKLIANFEHTPWQETSGDYLNNAKSYVEVATSEMYRSVNGVHQPLELYDLENDPGETQNLAQEEAHRETRDGLIKVLHAWMERTGDPLLHGPMAQGAYRERMAAFKEAAR